MFAPSLYTVGREPGVHSFHRSPMKEVTLSLRQKYRAILTQLAPLGAVGISLALGAVAPAAASEPPAGNPPAATNEGIADRLAAIRDAVSAVDQLHADAAKSSDRLDLAYWWGPGYGWYGYRPWSNWNNWWHNWGNFFRNW